MTVDSAELTYAACGLLIAVYASGRFNTPPSNRSSTRQALYWWSWAGYVLSALALFSVLSILMQATMWRTALLGPADSPSLPAPLIATLAMTTLLPAIPMLKRLDDGFLSVFLDWAEIPAEVKRRTAAMTPESFEVSAEDVVELRESYGDGSYGDGLARHLRVRSGGALELSQYRLTQLVKLYDRIRKLAAAPAYRRFYAESEKEFAELDRRAVDFLIRASASLTLAERLHSLENEAAYEALAQERRQAFGKECREIFHALALFLARGALRSEASEKGIVHGLRQAGFAATEPMNLPRFPIDSLTVLALGIFAYLLILILLLGNLVGMRQHGDVGGLMIAAKAAFVRLATIGLTVWLIQHYSFFRRSPGDSPRIFAYLVNGAAASAGAAAICAFSHLLGDADIVTALRGDLPLILLTFPLCTTVALCCDDWLEDRAPPAWLRVAEAAGCAAVMAAGMGLVLIYLSDSLPFAIEGLPGWKVAMVILFPATIALAIGGWVPHIYRAARRAANARRCEAALRASRGGGSPAPQEYARSIGPAAVPSADAARQEGSNPAVVAEFVAASRPIDAEEDHEVMSA